MIYRILFVVCIAIFSSCEKKNSSVTVVISGVVRDELTDLPVAGATVALKVYWCIDGDCHSHEIPGTTIFSGDDGSYIINYKYNIDNPFVWELSTFSFPDSYCTYALKENYIGSDQHYLFDKVYENADIKLFHSAQLNIHVKNGGINKVDGVTVYVDKGYGIYHPFGSPQYAFYCKGVKFDSILILNNLWGNINYSYKVVQLNSSPHSFNYFLYSSIIPKPDSITDLYIPF